MKKYFIYILIALCSVCNIHAEFSLIHKPGAYNKLQENGMQKTHTDYQIMYAKPGEIVYLYRPERATFVGWIRWYCYDTDRAVPFWYSAEESPTGVAIKRLESTWQKDTTENKFKAKTKYGWIAYGYTGDRVTTLDRSYIEVKYTMHSGDSIYRIACDHGIYNDFVWHNSTPVTEPTLSKRTIYEIHPASEMAAQMEVCKDMDGTNDTFLEEYNMIAPTGRQLYIGPKYMYQTKKIQLAQYVCYARSNYYYINSQGNPTSMGSDLSKWKWYKNGIEDSTIKTDDKLSAQFVAVSNKTEDTVVYELKYNSANGVYFNVARFTIKYVDKNIVGPVKTLSVKPQKIDKIYEQTFNFDKPDTTDFTFWRGHLDVDESSYGYYDKNLDETESTSSRKIRKGNITWSEFAITNKKSIWVNGNSSDPQTYQHVYNTENVLDNAKEGYMLYCDGSQQPGTVFNLKIYTDLCPGTTMYFSAYLCDASSTGNGKSAPNMDFEVIGVDTTGVEYALTTFTTGEFGVNAAEEVGKTKKMERAKWYQIMFPIKFTSETTYPVYRLRITNKSTSSDGNDFAIDDICIYVQKPPVNPIQASTYDCPTSSIDSITTYLRVDYQAIDEQCEKFYYQWRDVNQNILKLRYFNNSMDSTYGFVNVPETEDDIIASGDTCLSLLSFDAQYFNTDTPVVKYIKERIDVSTERYLMYIAQPMIARTNYNYTGHVAVRIQDLGHETECGTKSDLLVAGGTRILINGEALGDSVVDACGNRSYTLDIVLTYIAQDTTIDELREYTTPCKADWLVGDSSYVNNNIDIYRYTFKQIEYAIEDYRTTNPTDLSNTIVHHLLKHNLLVLNEKTIKIEPSKSLSYTAFPIGGSAENHMSVCLTPRFLYLSTDDGIINMMKVGNEGDDLPEVVAGMPRIIRISNAQKRIGYFNLPLYLSGDEHEKYIIDSVYIISSTAPNYPKLKLNTNKDTINIIDTVLLGSEKLNLLAEGYDYTFHVAFVGESEEDKCNRGYTYFTLRIIPDMVTWYGKEWNDDNNWDTYIPMKETNVLLLYNTDYVVSFNDSSIAKYDINYTENECNNIYFPDGASMYGQERIKINGIAFIDVKEYAWKWTLTSIPIKGVVSGDFFISTNESVEPFIVAPINQTVGLPATDRTTWEVYRKEFDVDTKTWKTATNSLTTEIEEGITNMIGIDCDSDNINPIIRLPKQDDMYHYYDKNTHNWLNESEYITRSETYGKPIWNGDTIIHLKQTYDSIYLFGNPTFGYVNIYKLIEDNKDKFTGEYYFEPTGATSIPKKNQIITFNRNITTDEYEMLLPPYRGVLLKGTYKDNSLIINVGSSYINPSRIPKKITHNNDNTTTSIDNISINEAYIVYDIMGHHITAKFDELPNGIYIICNGKNRKKALIYR